VYHSGLAMVKNVAFHGYASITTSVKFVKGVHYVEFRIINSFNNAIFIGVQSQLGPLNTYPGNGPYATGKALHGYNGFVYADGDRSDYSLDRYGAGDYVGVLLNMNNKTVTFYINGRSGRSLPLVDDGYYFVVTVFNVGQSVELVPQHSYHKTN